ncbi:MAG: hypothetical protein GQ550_02825 [Gammaproteobacteria bacterium]|nr:hypothetical protein [Gammaproteobacteria bacterium]
MTYHHYISNITFSLLIIILSACSGGPAEKTLPDSLTSPAKLLDQGIYHYNNNNYPKAIRDFEKALLQYRSIDNQPGIANSCLNLAKTYMAINNNQIAAEYLSKAGSVIMQAQLDQLDEHLHLLKSSLAIKNKLYDQALQELNPVLTSKNITIKLAALKNRTTIAFIKNDTDKQQWLEKYKTLQSSDTENTSSHLARILRFEAELTDDENRKDTLLTQSLSISQSHASRTAIAATLTQWANIDIENGRYSEAEDKSLRALFIRHQLGDVKSSIVMLKQLQTIYSATDNKKAALVNNWIDNLSSHKLSDWKKLYSDFETYPRLR